MCTIGALRFADGSYALFKNKDFGRPRFDDRITVEPDVFGVIGLSTWDESIASADVFSGFSIGANAHGVLCCDANVRTLPGHANYDDLVEIALREGTGVDTAIEAVAKAVERRPYRWANVTLIDRERMATVEVSDGRINVDSTDRPSVRTNHHVTRGALRTDDNVSTSQPRLDAARRRIRSVRSAGDLFDLMRTHDQGSTGICAHGPHTTVYGYVLHHTGEATTLSVVRGSPCESPLPTPMQIPIGDAWSAIGATEFRAAYPSTEASTVP